MTSAISDALTYTWDDERRKTGSRDSATSPAFSNRRRTRCSAIGSASMVKLSGVTTPDQSSSAMRLLHTRSSGTKLT